MTKSVTTIKKRFWAIVLALVTVLTILPVTKASAAENYDGGWAFSKANHTVYGSASGGSAIGSIGREGITVLSRSGSTYYIEYSTLNGPKRGYIINPDLDTSSLSSSCVAKVSTSCTTYYGNSSSLFNTAGSVSVGEYVAVIDKMNEWAYIEYNTNSGKRKRGYVLFNNLYCYNRPGYFADFYPATGQKETINTKIQRKVYAGPNESYEEVGYIDDTDKNVPCYYDYLFLLI